MLSPASPTGKQPSNVQRFRERVWSLYSARTLSAVDALELYRIASVRAREDGSARNARGLFFDETAMGKALGVGPKAFRRRWVRWEEELGLVSSTRPGNRGRKERWLLPEPTTADDGEGAVNAELNDDLSFEAPRGPVLREFQADLTTVDIRGLRSREHHA